LKETYTKKDAKSWMVPMNAGKPSSIIEIPANWHLDDWPPFQFSFHGPSHGFVDPWVLEKLWKDQFEFCYREYDTFIFPISIHPQVSGKPQVMLMHERFIEFINSHEGVEWVTMEQMVDEFKAGKISGATV
jgi:peptidoglycan/xylan/chitin deacetylase (PgdA/CDA1 family)